MIDSLTLKKLRTGEFVRGAVLGSCPESWLAEVIGRLGYDVIWLDMEHNCFDYDRIGPIALACRATGIDLMVRILKSGYASPMRALEAGANGIMIPHCMDATEARRWVEWARFHPLGKRGFDGAGVDADYMLADPIEHMRHANDQTFLVLQIEDREALSSVEEIAATDGVDMLFIGTGDLSISLGVPMQFDHPLVQHAIDRVAGAAQKAGKWWSMPTGSVESAQVAVSRGARMVFIANDHVLLVKGFQNAAKEYQGLVRRSIS
jgi:4-hydroxy-2-oxoheptanedioate aldolase